MVKPLKRMIGSDKLRQFCGVFGSLLAANLAFAGEPIIVGKEKPRPDAVKDSKFNKELSRPFDGKSMSPGAFDGIMLPTIPRLDAPVLKTDRKRRLQELEKKNWMYVKEGELQEEEEKKNFLGVRDYDYKEEQESDNLMFRDLERERSQPSKNQSRSSSQQKEQPEGSRRVDAEELQRELDARRAARESARGADYGAHTSSELNLKGLLAPPSGGANRGSDFSLKEMLGAAPAAQNRNQALRDEFNAFLQGKSGGAPPAAGSGDLINSWRTDSTRQTFNPAIAKTPETRPAAQGFGASRASANFGAGAGFESVRMPSAIPGVGIVPPIQPPPPRTFTPAGGDFNRGLGMNSLGGHSR